jgi:hypothetical protein
VASGKEYDIISFMKEEVEQELKKLGDLTPAEQVGVFQSIGEKLESELKKNPA